MLFSGVRDAGLIRKVAWSWGSYVECLEADWLPAAGSDLSQGTIESWALETHRTAGELFGIQPANGVFDDGYLIKVRPTLDKQLAVAGPRLAKVLNDGFAAKRCDR